MKNLVYALVGAGFMIACQPSDQPEISGMLTGIESDTLLVPVSYTHLVSIKMVF